MLYVGYDDPVTTAKHGLAYSTDLINWTKSPSNPVFGPSGINGTPDENGTSGPFVYYEDGTYYLFYIGLSGAGYEGGTVSMCLATSTSLTGTWTRHGAIISPSGTGWRRYKIWHPNVVKEGSTYYLFFNAQGDYDGVNNKERIGYATASSLMGPWTVDDVNSPVISIGPNGSWDERMAGDPCLFKHGNFWYMAYYGADDPLTRACDGYAYTTVDEFPLGWRKYEYNPVIEPSESYDNVYAAKPFIYIHNGIVYHYYTAVNSTDRQIAVATRTL